MNKEKGKQKQTWREKYPPAKPDQEPVLVQVIGRDLDYPSGHKEEDKESGGGGGNDDQRTNKNKDKKAAR